ncbi:S-locus glycoprotein domain-containing protein [Artemisia annua]|uniref:S-locus glycoprotein domain-containing protein n=1 Tax=Artemisia annua TaxID=35608 RepID=A0A2U1PPK8_ARTAN|nr:S-locus glycoprotein domain-containing protein [Artemisia annua]
MELTLNASGNLVATVWQEQSKNWQVVFSYPRDICDGYNNCGGYGSCSDANMVTKSCACLDQYRFVPKDDDLSGGCVRRTPLACKNGSEAFINIILLWYTRRKKNHADSMINGKLVDVSENKEAMELPLFNFSTIANATAIVVHFQESSIGHSKPCISTSHFVAIF